MIYVEINEYSTIPEEFDYEAFKACWPHAPEDKPEDWYGIKRNARLMPEEAASLAALGLRVEVKPLPGAMLVKMKDEENRHRWHSGQRVSLEDTLNQTVAHITIPDIGVLHINDVTVLYDACTDDLQTHLNEGWRILAVCPPNSQRRPDYILGRSIKGDD